MNTWNSRFSIYVVIAVTCGLSAASFFIPVPPHIPYEAETHWRIAITVAEVSLMSGAALLLLQGLSAFKTDLRMAYRWLSFGMVLFALAVLQLPIIAIFRGENSLWVLSGAIVLPFIVSVLLVYKGIRQFAQLLQIDSRLTSWFLVIGLVTAFALMNGAAAYVYLRTIGPSGVDDNTFLYTAAVAWSAGFVTLTWVLAIRVRTAIGESYKKPMMWLVAAFGMLSFSALHECLTSYFVSTQDWYLYSGAISWPFIVSGILFIIAGYMFDAKRITVPQAQTSDAAVNLSRAYINSIANAARLASRPEDISPILDGMRGVPAFQQPDAVLSPDDRIQLLDTYRQLEEYLVSSDPLKTFNKEQVRAVLALEFRSQVESVF